MKFFDEARAAQIREVAIRLERGESFRAVADTMGLSRHTVYGWIDTYRLRNTIQRRYEHRRRERGRRKREWFDADPGRCSECGADFQWVRPGKAQATCRCWATCPTHGPNAITYHNEGEFPQVSGWFCGQCESKRRAVEVPDPEDAP